MRTRISDDNPRFSPAEAYYVVRYLLSIGRISAEDLQPKTRSHAAACRRITRSDLRSQPSPPLRGYFREVWNGGKAVTPSRVTINHPRENPGNEKGATAR